MLTSYALAAPTFFGSCARRKMPLLVFLSAQNSAWIWKSLYEFFVTSRLLLSFALSATIAPPSARQLASPRRVKFSSPFSPSMSVLRPITPSMVVQPTASTAAAKTIKRFMFVPSLVVLLGLDVGSLDDRPPFFDFGFVES